MYALGSLFSNVLTNALILPTYNLSVIGHGFNSLIHIHKTHMCVCNWKCFCEWGAHFEIFVINMELNRFSSGIGVLVHLTHISYLSIKIINHLPSTIQNIHIIEMCLIVCVCVYACVYSLTMLNYVTRQKCLTHQDMWMYTCFLLNRLMY